MHLDEKLLELGLTKEQYEECMSLIIDKKNGNVDIDWQEIIDKYDIKLSVDYLRKANASIFGGAFAAEYFKNINKDNDSSYDNTDELVQKSVETSMNKDGSWSSKRLMIMNDEQSKDADFMLKAHGFDPVCWRIVSLRNNIRQVISKQDGVVTLYASFLTVRPVEGLTEKQIENFYKKLLNKYKTPVVKKRKVNNSGLLLEIPIQDVHFGKLSLQEDVTEPYNYNLAKERFSYVIDDIIQNVQGYDIEKIIFPIGSDFFHIDTANFTTTAGTKQNSDLSPQLIFKYGLECLIENILKLSQVAPIEVFCVNGNHDFLSSYHAICSIECYFHNDENITVNTNTSPRKYIEWYSVLLGFAHGDKEKKRLEGLMQIEASEAWGRTKYREFHCGHLHSLQTKEVNGVIIRHLSSFTGTDLWHRDKGYVGAVKQCESFLWDKDKGLRNIIVTTVD